MNASIRKIIHQALVAAAAGSGLVGCSSESAAARAMCRWARRFGAHVPAVRATPAHVRPLAAVLDENAVEGAVRETMGAAVAAWQAMHATDLELAQDMAAIAEDEASHAQLAWDLLAWVAPRLGRAEQACFRARQRSATEDLRRPPIVSRDATQFLGLPDTPTWARIHGALEARLWT